MRRFVCFVLTTAFLFLLAACASAGYAPPGETTGDEALDAEVLTVLLSICEKGRSVEENAREVYAWVQEELQYRASTADTSGGFTPETTAALAAEALEKRRGACDGEAALLAVLLRRIGVDCVIAEGQFLRDDGSEWVDHAWVIAGFDGTYAHLDPLYGRYYAADTPFAYFMAKDEFMLKTHRWERDRYPSCD